jgi:negative regulator of sigma-B (phosphoserine phosphatase)
VSGSAVADLSRIEWGVAARAASPEEDSGNQSLIRPFPGGVLVAAVDGLGHGDSAARVAGFAIRMAASRPHVPVDLQI